MFLSLPCPMTFGLISSHHRQRVRSSFTSEIVECFIYLDDICTKGVDFFKMN